MKYLLLCVLIIFIFPLLGQLEWGDGIEYAESHNTLFGDMLMIGDTGYYCWIEDIGSELYLHVQGFDSTGESVWETPILQETSYDLPGKVRICSSQEGDIFLLWQSYSADEDVISNSIQKIDPEGNKLWGDSGIEIVNPEEECLEILSDGNGGIYTLFEYDEGVTAWHYDENGQMVSGWEEGIFLGNTGSNEMSSSLSYTQSSNGELVTFTRQTLGDEFGVYVQEYDYNGEMEYPDQGLIIGGVDNTSLSISNTGSDEYLLSWHQNGGIAGNKLLANGELLYDEAVVLYPDCLVFIYDTQIIDNTIYLILSDDASTIMVGSYDENWQELISPEDVQICYDHDPIILIKDNGNILLIDNFIFTGSIMEFDSNGNLISPENGWLAYFTYSCNIKVSTDNNVINLYWEQNSQLIQTIYDEGEILYEEPRVLGRNKIISGLDHGVRQTEEKLIFYSHTSNNGYYISYLNEAGDILYSGLLGADNQLPSTYIISNDDNGFYIISSITNEDRTHDDYLLRIDTTSEPELVWGTSGLYLRTAIHSEHGLYAFPLWDDMTLFYWYVDDEIIGQLSDGNELLWESGGESIDVWSESGTLYLVDYKEGYLSYVVNNYPEHYEYINRIDSDFDPVWEEPVLLRTEIDSEIYYDYVSETELYYYWVNNNDNNWKLSKQIITETGEKLCGEEGEIILETGNEDIIQILTDENNNMMGIVTGEIYEPEITYFTMQGEPLEIETVSFPQITDMFIDKIVLKDGYVIFFTKNYTSLAWELQIYVYDLESNLIPELPELDYSVYTIWDNLIFEDEDAIYFTYNHKHHDEDQFWLPNGGSGIDMVAQKLLLPNLSLDEEEIYEFDEMITAYPNPFNPEVTISFDLSQRQFIELDVYNIKGQQVKNLAASEYSFGRHEIIWKGDNDQGTKVSSGVYYLKLQMNSDIYTEKVVLIK